MESSTYIKKTENADYKITLCGAYHDGQRNWYWTKFKQSILNDKSTYNYERYEYGYYDNSKKIGTWYIKTIWGRYQLRSMTIVEYGNNCINYGYYSIEDTPDIAADWNSASVLEATQTITYKDNCIKCIYTDCVIDSIKPCNIEESCKFEDEKCIYYKHSKNGRIYELWGDNAHNKLTFRIKRYLRLLKHFT